MSDPPASFCPKCGTQRTGALRFCRSCGFDLDTVATTPQPTAQEPLGTMPIDRRAQASYYRATVGWSCLGRVMVWGGVVVGFLIGAYVAEGPLAGGGILTQLFVGFVVGPFLGAGIGWYLWTELWGRR